MDDSHGDGRRPGTPRYGRVLQARRPEGTGDVFQPGWPARVQTLCPDGVVLHLAEPFSEGTVLTVCFYDRRDTRLGRFDLRVARVVPQPNGTWILGAAFLDAPDDPQLQELLGAPFVVDGRADSL